MHLLYIELKYVDVQAYVSLRPKDSFKQNFW